MKIWSTITEASQIDGSVPGFKEINRIKYESKKQQVCRKEFYNTVINGLQ